MEYVYEDGDLTYTRTAMQLEYGDWVDSYPWKYWVVLTFGKAPSKEKANRLHRKFVNGLQRRYRDPIQWVSTIEGDASKQPHIHALWMTDADLNLEAAEETWKRFNGKPWIKPYDSLRSNRTTYILKSSQELDYSDNFGKVPLRSSLVPSHS